jgi:hypothetical protein
MNSLYIKMNDTDFVKENVLNLYLCIEQGWGRLWAHHCNWALSGYEDNLTLQETTETLLNKKHLLGTLTWRHLVLSVILNHLYHTAHIKLVPPLPLTTKVRENIQRKSSNVPYTVRCEVFTAVTMKNVVFWDIKPQFVLHRRHITSPLQSSAG